MVKTEGDNKFAYRAPRMVPGTEEMPDKVHCPVIAGVYHCTHFTER